MDSGVDRIHGYSMELISKPFFSKPFISYRVKKTVLMKKELMRKYKREKKSNILTYTPILGVIPGIFFYTSGYVFLGEVMAVTSVTTGGVLFWFQEFSPPDTVENRVMKTYVDTIPAKNELFTVKLKRKSFECRTDEKGFLKIGLSGVIPYINKNSTILSVESRKGDTVKKIKLTPATAPFLYNEIFDHPEPSECKKAGTGSSHD